MELYALNEAFYTLQMMNPLSSGQIALWHAIVRIANKSRWQEWFTVASITLVQLTGLSPEGVKKARNELKQRGLIDFKPDKGRATRYKLVDISKSTPVSTLVSTPVSTLVSTPVSTLVSTPVSTALNKQDIYDTTPLPPQGESPDGGGASRYIDEHIRGMTPGNWEELRSYLDDGLTMDLICHAVDEAAAQQKRNWAYVRGILNRYLTEGIKTVGQAKGGDKPQQPQQKPRTRKEIYTVVIGGVEHERIREVPI
jgi:DnaD/phage-associated family protein